MKILTIGNSFSRNSTHYLPEICAEAGIELTLGGANLGGCSLEQHWNNASRNVPTYGADWAGDKTMCEVLESEQWEYITMQQASHYSWKIGTYQPYLDKLTAFVREHAPQAQLVVHQTWAYRTDNERLMNEFKISQAQMFHLIQENYNTMAARLKAPILPVGDALRIMQELTGDTVGCLTRNPDGPSHANALGEYIGALIWFARLCGGNIDGVSFVPDGVKAWSVPLAKEAAKTALEMYK
ncbi:MAG: DUF4886 domain-containing protein [Clostridia bacterium]|nr:DUF4886 domain-containing protein [Clostridia bacterium]